MAEELQVGDVLVVGGRRCRYLGQGRFEPIAEEEIFAKRFDPCECGPFLGRTK